MPWDDIAQYESKLNQALQSFNWPEAADISQTIIQRTKSEPDLIPEQSAKVLMYALRRKRRFSLMTQLGDAMIQSGLRTQQVRRQYAQALIDQGTLTAAEMVLQSIIHEPQGVRAEELEARGLIGRIYKQIYVNNKDPKSPVNRANLERALNEYQFVYRLDPGKLWHGINVVALAARAKADDLPLAGLPDSQEVAREVLATLAKNEAESAEPLPAWDVATRMEAFVALGRHKDAVDTALRYVDDTPADAFEIFSTLRQFEEVWRLTDTEPPGDVLLPILKAGHLKKEGSFASCETSALKHEANVAGEAMGKYEAIFGDTRMVTLKWYKNGLDRCNSVARVESLDGKGHGTGWLVRAEDFFPGDTGVLLLTNNHVVSPSPVPLAILPNNCQINFQAVGEVLEVEKKVRWYNSYLELDATFLKLKSEPKAPALEISEVPMAMAQPAPRMYIIGHPCGRDLELSLQDNHLVGCNDTLLHYRTPTEPGSSGSPVFEPVGWRVVGLHHMGTAEMKRLDGVQGTYKANEAISILALQKATRNQ
jgi:trypsin-like peptidase/tetratricopeptide repeat protein